MVNNISAKHTFEKLTKEPNQVTSMVAVDSQSCGYWDELTM